MLQTDDTQNIKSHTYHIIIELSWKFNHTFKLFGWFLNKKHFSITISKEENNSQSKILENNEIAPRLNDEDYISTLYKIIHLYHS